MELLENQFSEDAECNNALGGCDVTSRDNHVPVIYRPYPVAVLWIPLHYND